jgi:hypothetical protein
MNTRTKPTPAPAWPAHATVTGAHPKTWHAADAYEAARAAGCTLPSDLIHRVTTVATAADWRLDLDRQAADLSNTWDNDAMTAARSGDPMPDLAPLMRRDQLLAVQGEVAHRIGAIITAATTAVVAFMRDEADTIVVNHLRPRFDTLVTEAATLADTMSATITDDAAALRASQGPQWLALEAHAATYRHLLDARQALAEITGWPITDPRRISIIGAHVTIHGLDREPTHAVARFAHRIRNREALGLWMPTLADVTSLIEREQ